MEHGGGRVVSLPVSRGSSKYFGINVWDLSRYLSFNLVNHLLILIKLFPSLDTCIYPSLSPLALFSFSRVLLSLLALSWWWEKHFWKQLEMHFVWSKLEFSGDIQLRTGETDVCGQVITGLNLIIEPLKTRLRTVIYLTEYIPLSYAL